MKIQRNYPIDVDVDGQTIKLSVRRLNFEEGSALRAQIREATAKETYDKEGIYGENLVTTVIRDYVTVTSEVIMEYEVVDKDGKTVVNDNGESRMREEPIKTGDDILNAFGGRNDILLEVYEAVVNQNKLSAKEKKASSSATGSPPSSGELAKAVAGQKPGTTADAAGPEASANNGDATSPEKPPSGSTGQSGKPPSLPTNARSYH